MYKIKARAGDWAEKEGKVELKVWGEKRRGQREEGEEGKEDEEVAEEALAT